MLTEQEMNQLKSLMDRAIANRQFQIGVLSPFADPADDMFDEGDRHDGFCAMSDKWKTWSMLSSEDDGPESALLKLLIDQKSLDYVTNGITCSSVECNNECIEEKSQPAGIRCPECETQNWNYEFKSPVDPAGDRFVCQNGHKFKRYDGTRYGGTFYSR